MSDSGLVVSRIGEVTVVNFQNVSILDTHAVEAVSTELHKIVETQARRRVLLNFAAVQYLSSHMIAVLLTLHKSIQANRGKLVLCCVRSELKKIFDIMKLQKVLQSAETESEGMSMVQAR